MKRKLGTRVFFYGGRHRRTFFPAIPKKKEKEKKRTRKKKHVETKTAVSFSLKSAFVNSKFIIVSLH